MLFLFLIAAAETVYPQDDKADEAQSLVTDEAPPVRIVSRQEVWEIDGGPVAYKIQLSDGRTWTVAIPNRIADQFDDHLKRADANIDALDRRIRDLQSKSRRYATSIADLTVSITNARCEADRLEREKAQLPSFRCPGGESFEHCTHFRLKDQWRRDVEQAQSVNRLIERQLVAVQEQLTRQESRRRLEEQLLDGQKKSLQEATFQAAAMRDERTKLAARAAYVLRIVKHAVTARPGDTLLPPKPIKPDKDPASDIISAKSSAVH
jgi:hypothetical protein